MPDLLRITFAACSSGQPALRPGYAAKAASARENKTMGKRRFLDALPAMIAPALFAGGAFLVFCADSATLPVGILLALTQLLLLVLSLREHRVSRRMEQQGERDRLTRLYNRETFFEKTRPLLDRSPPGTLAMAYFDIDGFCALNARYGYAVGDSLLRYLAEQLRIRTEQAGGVCCRVSADVFAFLIPCSGDIFDRTDRMSNEDVLRFGLPIAVTLTFGWCVVDDPALSASDLLDRAALAQAHIKGRSDIHHWVYSDALRAQMLDEQEIVGRMEAALTGGEFKLYLQPQYDCASGVITGAEVLVRWQRPDGSLIAPDRFIPLFEQNGFIFKLDQYIWEETCRLLRRWLDEGNSPPPLSVNVSRFDLLAEDFYESITSLVRQYDLLPAIMPLEITESAFAGATGQLISMTERLRAFGFIIEIDDFGSGYSSFNTLKDVPAEILKLDMHFLDGAKHAQRGEYIITSVIRLAHQLDMSVIAEGVETRRQADFLLAAHCSRVQGYLYARPMSVPAFESLWLGAESE